MSEKSANLLRKPQIVPGKKDNPFERFGLSQNPFPNKPSLVVGSDNPPYLAELRAKEEREFENWLIPHPDRSKPRLITFLMDYATRRGRGIGKTAFLNHQCKRIMRDLGSSLTNDTYVLFATYILPLPGGKCRKFWQFSQLIAEAITEQDMVAMAMWRLRAFSGLIPAEILEQVGDNLEETIGNDVWLRRHDVDVDFKLVDTLKDSLEQAGIRAEVAEILSRYGHDSSTWRRNFLAHQTDFRWRQIGNQLVFDDLVRLFVLAGFSKGLLLIDEVEKIVPYQNISERRAFVESLRYFFIDGPCENTRRDFYSLFLTIHPYLQELLAPHWEAAGLDRFAALSREFAQEYTVYFGPLNQELAEPLVKTYLDAYRIDNDQKGPLWPLDKAAVEEALFRTGGVPGKMLTLLYQIMERAIKEKWNAIGAEQIRQVIQVNPPEEPGGDEFDSTALPSSIPDLKKEG